MSEDVVEIISESEKNGKRYYLSHHPVIKADSLTSKIWPIFYTSYRLDNSLSLNDCMTKSPNLVEEIPVILIQFNEKALA